MRKFTCGTASSKYSNNQIKSPNNSVTRSKSKTKKLSGEESLEEYVQLAMCFDLKDRELEKIADHINYGSCYRNFRNETLKKFILR